MEELNAISNSSIFRRTRPGAEFSQAPLRFIDIGAAGGVHPRMLPVASITHCLCFEPDPAAFGALTGTDSSPFAGMTVHNTIVGARDGRADFFLTRNGVTSSLLRPGTHIRDRYGKTGLNIKETVNLPVRTLDSIVAGINSQIDYQAEIIKLDCQGAEYEIIEASPEAFGTQCMSVWCEVEFYPIYENQKTFSDIDPLLRSKGFVLYGLTPKYISRRMLDRKEYETNERTLWADAIYFRDPLDETNSGLDFTKRQIDVLIMCAAITGFFDLAAEIVSECVEGDEERKRLLEFVRHCAARKRRRVENDAKRFIDTCQKNPHNSYLIAKKFVDNNKDNNDVDFLAIEY